MLCVWRFPPQCLHSSQVETCRSVLSGPSSQAPAGLPGRMHPARSCRLAVVVACLCTHLVCVAICAHYAVPSILFTRLGPSCCDSVRYTAAYHPVRCCAGSGVPSRQSCAGLRPVPYTHHCCGCSYAPPFCLLAGSISTPRGGISAAFGVQATPQALGCPAPSRCVAACRPKAFLL